MLMIGLVGLLSPEAASNEAFLGRNLERRGDKKPTST